MKQLNPAVIQRERKGTDIGVPSSERRTRRVKQLNPAVIQRERKEGQQWLDPAVREGQEE